MKVILLKEVQDLGKPDDIVEVHDGYARNYLIRQHLALEASPANLNDVKTRKQAESARINRELANARQIGSQISGQVFTLPMKCGEGGRLYGAVTAMDVAEALAKSGFKVDKRGIAIHQPIKTTGEYDIDIRLHTEVNIKVKVRVIAI
ncbi:MAG TPA: 50S ribosomal protein L9 [Clostridiales bacterium]|nr:50S ribosomal protein L9 [Clostridiales bacterium]